jgi:hypothetical protein
MEDLLHPIVDPILVTLREIVGADRLDEGPPTLGLSQASELLDGDHAATSSSHDSPAL